MEDTVVIKTVEEGASQVETNKDEDMEEDHEMRENCPNDADVDDASEEQTSENALIGASSKSPNEAESGKVQGTKPPTCIEALLQEFNDCLIGTLNDTFDQQKLSSFVSVLETYLENGSLPEGKAQALVKKVVELTNSIVNGKCKSGLIEELKSLRATVSTLLQTVRPVNLDTLYRLLKSNQAAGDSMQDKDVLLLIGETGSGKTTTLLFLTGASFEKVESDGFHHLKPFNFPKPDLKDFVTSCGTRSITQTVMSTSVDVNGEDIVISDTPGFGDTDGVEMDIANGLGMIHAIHRAKSVKPVLVLSVTGFGDRFQRLTETLTTVTRMYQSSVDFLPFSYVFTNCRVDEEENINKKLMAFRKNLAPKMQSDHLFVDFVDDMIKKTATSPNVVFPDKGGGPALLRDMWTDNERVSCPETSFKPFVPDATSQKLHSMLKGAVDSITHSLKTGDLELTLYRLQQLSKLDSVLPEATEYYQRGQELAKKHISSGCEAVWEHVEIFRNIHQRDENSCLPEMESVRTKMLVVCDLERLRTECEPDQFRMKDFCCRVVQELGGIIGKDLLEFDLEFDMETLLEKGPCILLVLAKLRSLGDILKDCPGVEEVDGIYGKVSERVSNIANRAILLTSGDVAYSPGGLSAFDKRAAFLWKLTEVLLEEPDGDWTWLKKSLEQLMEKLEIKVVSAVDALQAFQNNRSTVGNHDCLDSLLTMDIEMIGNEMSLLVTASKMPFLTKYISRCPKASNFREVLSSFEEAMVSFIHDAAASSEKSLYTLLTSENKDVSGGSKEVFGELCAKLSNADRVLNRVLVWSDRLTKAACDDARRFSALLGKTQVYREIPDATDRALELKKGIEEAYQEAKGFFNGMVEEKFDFTNALTELAEGKKWNSWMMACESQSAGDVFGIISGMTYKSLGKVMGSLKNGLTSIARQFYNKLADAANRVPKETFHGATEFEIVQSMLESISMDLTFVVKFCTLDEELSLVKQILSFDKSGNMRQNLLAALKGAAAGFDSLGWFYRELLKKMKFDEMSNCLTLWEGMKMVLRKSLSTTNVPALGSAAEKSNDTLRDHVIGIRSYEDLQPECIGAINDCKNIFSSRKFTRMCEPGNAVERTAFYKETSEALVAAKGASRLAGRFGAGALIYTDALKIVLQGTHWIGARLLEAIEKFPSGDVDFERIRLSGLNLAAIEDAFQRVNVSQEVEQTASSLLENAHQAIALRLHDFLKSFSLTNQNQVKHLVLLKKAIRDVSAWEGKINEIVDLGLLEASKRTQSPGAFLLELSLELHSIDGEDSSAAKQLLLELKCFEGAKNALFNDATERQDIDCVLEHLQLSAADVSEMKGLYESFDVRYKKLVMEGLVALKAKQGAKEDFFTKLSLEATGIATNFSISYSDQVCCLSAHIFAHWSIKNIGSFLDVVKEKDDGRKFLMKPHAAQVIAIWMMLNTSSSKHKQIRNHLVEIKSGEGKSIVLGVTATILALLGFEVDCVCYSSYLAERDQKAFDRMLRDFGVSEHVKYGTIDGKKVWLKDQIRRLTSSVIAKEGDGKRNDDGHRVSRKQNRMKVMLVDEVDVFFKQGSFGHGCYPFVNIKDFSALIKFIWHNRDLAEGVLLRSRPAQKCLANVSDDFRLLLEHRIGAMLKSAKKVGRGSHLDVNSTAPCRGGYDTIFACMKEEEKKVKVKRSTTDCHLAARFACGIVSFSELPVSYDVILGVSGKLKGLPQAELEVLKDKYAITQYSDMPSVYGNNKLKFAGEDGRDVILCDSRQKHFTALGKEISLRQSPSWDGYEGVQRAVMVFFDSRETLFEFYNSDAMQSLRSTARKVTKDVDELEREAAFLEATEQGAVTLMTREYGRGTDFKCSDSKMLQAGGVHVIQTYFSVDLAEEIQIKGRCARQGANGSFSMVLDVGVLREQLGIPSEDVHSMRSKQELYSSLDRWRTKTSGERFKKKLRSVQKIEDMHYRTLAFQEAMAEGGRRDEVVRFLSEINRCGDSGDSGAFAETGLKSHFVGESNKRIREHEQSDVAKRQKVC